MHLKVMPAFLYEEKGKAKMVVTDKNSLDGTNKGRFKEVTLIIPLEQIKKWVEEAEVMGMT